MRFPFLDHFTIAQADMVERWRTQWSDQSIVHAAVYPSDVRGRTMPLWREIASSGLTPGQLHAYFLRNPRSRCDAA